MVKLGYKVIGRDAQGNPIFQNIIPFPGTHANSCDAEESAHGVFSDSAPILLKNGFSPLPIAPGEKYPAGVKGWSARCEEPMTLQEIQGSALVYRAYGVGVACGYNNLTAVDVDTDDLEIIRIIESVLPEAVVKKKGKKGFTLFYQYEGEGPAPSFSFFDKSEKKFVDILGDGRQTVIPPTIHPETGAPYFWLSQKTLFNTSVNELPKLTAAHLDDLEEALKPYLWERPSWSADEGAREALPADHVFSEQERRRYVGNAETALAARVKAVSEAPKGSRNWTLFIAICYIGKNVHHRFLDENKLIKLMLDACQANGLIDDDGQNACLATIRSGLHISRNDPLPVLGDRSKPGGDGKRESGPGHVNGARYEPGPNGAGPGNSAGLP